MADAAMIETILTKPFAAEEYKSLPGRGSGNFTYVEDETVMDRLDEAFGSSSWSVEVSPIADRCVRVRITALYPDGVTKVAEDFGYASDGAPEPYKDATTDGIRRVGRIFGIARDVYAGKVKPGKPAQQARPVAQPVAVEEPEYVQGPPIGEPRGEFEFTRYELAGQPKECPEHHTSKLNKRGYYCPTKVGDAWCQWTAAA